MVPQPATIRDYNRPRLAQAVEGCVNRCVGAAATLRLFTQHATSTALPPPLLLRTCLLSAALFSGAAREAGRGICLFVNAAVAVRPVRGKGDYRLAPMTASRRGQPRFGPCDNKGFSDGSSIAVGG